ncbi:VTT domain-containing protein [Sporolactobacillus sp. CPB3-1]|uniref:VTT domain-containing protein n=1 Tax=Sporolactobacillus mangiferae TaxID=2940498 RepID=A0ABT0MF80_9BACL|nr:VTT domain-containing protein [Sporolactobacillus mangiferae]MCL1632914.1 VTT domain-containing protein [Sporolactobacillus mangiferae]
MSTVSWFIDVFLHIDQFLTQIVNQYGAWTYALLFAVIFIETGLVICPFLPGDSLLFAAGAIAAHNASELNIWLLLLLVAIAAVAGDTVNYWIGREIGASLEHHHRFKRLINKEKMAKAEKFFNKYGGFAVLLGRFAPFIRTFIPFIAGGSRMHYPFFLFYNILGGVIWTLAGLMAGFYFGQIPFVKAHFSLLMLLIVFVSLIPILLVWVKNLFKGQRFS